ncbi:hypothetical protein CapIbe_022946 [Capra ibex]
MDMIVLLRQEADEYLKKELVSTGAATGTASDASYHRSCSWIVYHWHYLGTSEEVVTVLSLECGSLPSSLSCLGFEELFERMPCAFGLPP